MRRAGAICLLGAVTSCAKESPPRNESVTAPAETERAIEAREVKLSESCQSLAVTLWQLEGQPLQERWASDYKDRTFEWGNWTIREIDRDRRVLRASGNCSLELVLSYAATATQYLDQIDARRATRSFVLSGALEQPPTFVRGQAGELRAAGSVGELPPPEVTQGLTIARACTLAPYEMKMGTWKYFGAGEAEPWSCVGMDVDMNTGRQAELSSENSLFFQVTGTEDAPSSLRLKLSAENPTSDVLRRFAMKAAELTLQASGQSMPSDLQQQLLEARPGRRRLNGFSGTITRDNHLNAAGFTLRYVLAVEGPEREKPPEAVSPTEAPARANPARPRPRRKPPERLELPCRPGQPPPCYD